MKFNVKSSMVKHKRKHATVAAQTPEAAVKKTCTTPKGWHWEELVGPCLTTEATQAIVSCGNKQWVMRLVDNG